MAIESKTFSGLNKKLDYLQDELTGQNAKKRLEVAGKKLEPYVEQAVARDIGDHSLSGWTHKSPMEIGGHSEIAKSTATGIFIAPGAKDTLWHRGLGPMRVLSEGRKGYAAGEMRLSGFRVRKKDGAIVAKRRRVKKATSATSGRNTWAEAEALIEANAAAAIDSALVEVALKKIF